MLNCPCIQCYISGKVYNEEVCKDCEFVVSVSLLKKFVQESKSCINYCKLVNIGTLDNGKTTCMNNNCNNYSELQLDLDKMRDELL